MKCIFISPTGFEVVSTNSKKIQSISRSKYINKTVIKYLAFWRIIKRNFDTTDLNNYHQCLFTESLIDKPHSLIVFNNLENFVLEEKVIINGQHLLQQLKFIRIFYSLLYCYIIWKLRWWYTNNSYTIKLNYWYWKK